jgi:hypothetical protein
MHSERGERMMRVRTSIRRGNHQAADLACTCWDVVIVTRLERPRTNYAATLSGYLYRHVSEAHA